MAQIALAVLLPVLFLTLPFVLTAWRPWKRSGCPSGAWGSAVGVALSYAATDIRLRGWHGLIPVSGGEWLPNIAIGSAIIVVALTAWKLTRARTLAAIILSATASALVLRSALAADWRAALPALAIATATGLGMWSGVWFAARRTKGARVPLMFWAASIGVALVLTQSESALLAPLAGALAAAMGVFVVLGWWRPDLPAVTGALPIYVLVSLGLLIAGRGFAGPWKHTDWSFVLAAMAIASPALTLVPPIQRLKPWIGTGVGVLITIALCVAGLFLSAHGFDFSGLE